MARTRFLDFRGALARMAYVGFTKGVARKRHIDFMASLARTVQAGFSHLLAKPPLL